MILTQTSVSQVTEFDPAQEGGCNRRWWFNRVQYLRPEQSNAQSDGEKGHALLAEYFRSGAMPPRARMGKAVSAAILKGDLPKPGPDLLVEQRFDGSASMWRPLPCDQQCLELGTHPDCAMHGEEPKREYIPFDPALTFQLGGLPWDGAIDLAYRRGQRPVVLDHKFCSDMDLYPPVPRERLIKTVQLPIYVLSLARRWPDAREWVIGHNNVGKTTSHGSRLIRESVTIDQARERGEQIAGLVGQMRTVAATESQDDVPFNRRACAAWQGCPHQSVCSAYRGNKMAFSAEDEALFNEIDGGAPVAAAPAPTLQERGEEEFRRGVTAAAKAARMAALKAELEAFAAPAPVAAVPAPRSRIAIVDVETPADQIPDLPAPVVAAAPAAFPPCANACGVTLDASNASRLRDGVIVHIGCPASVEAAPPPEPKKRGRPPKVPPPPPGAEPLATAIGITSSSASAPAPQSIPAAVVERIATLTEGEKLNEPAAKIALLADGWQPREYEYDADRTRVVIHELGPETLKALVRIFFPSIVPE